MTHTTLILTSVLVSAALLPQVLGQDEARPAQARAQQSPTQKAQAQVPFYLSEDKLDGMDLFTLQGAEAEEAIDLGDIANLLIDRESGKIVRAIISSGGVGVVGDTLRPIEWSLIQWRANEKGTQEAYVNLTEERFDAMPSFDPERLMQYQGKSMLDAAADKLEEGAEAIADQAPEAGEKLEKAAKEAMKSSQTLHLTDSIVGLPVHAPGAQESFASIGELIVEARSGEVAFVTLEWDDNAYLVPYSAVKLQYVKESDAWCFQGPLTKAEMAGAPPLNKDKGHNAMNPAYRKQVADYYSKHAAR